MTESATALTAGSQRGTDGVARDAALEGARAVAVGLVVLTHASFMTGFTVTGGLIGRLFGRGDYGVALFFALSGFLLHRQFLDAQAKGRHLSARGYAARRAARVLPAYWLTLAAVIVAVRPDLWDAVAHALTAQIYVPTSLIPAFSQSWSVATEIAFYAALPFAVAALRPLRHRRPDFVVPLLALIATVSLGGLLLFGTSFPGVTLVPDRLLPGAAPMFIVGMVLAEARRAGGAIPRALRRLGRDPVACWLVAGGTYVLATTPITGSLMLEPGQGSRIMVRVLLSVAFSLLVLLPLTLTPEDVPNWPRQVLGTSPVRWLGEMSYGVFLWHVPVFTGLYAVSGVPEFRGGIVPLLVLGLPVTLLLAWASHRFVEIPWMRWAARHAARYDRA